MVAATLVTAVVAAGGVFNLQAPDPRVGALEIQAARERMSVKEGMLNQLETTAVNRPQEIPASLQAAMGMSQAPEKPVGRRKGRQTP